MSEIISYKQEWLRKLIHLSSLWMPVLYSYTEKPFMLWATGVVTCVVLFADVGRHYLPITGLIFDKLFGSMLRSHEKQGKKLSGASYTLIAGFLTILLFEKQVAIAAIAILVVSDAAAALIGRKFGTTRLFDKSLQGTAAFFFSALVINYVVFTVYPLMVFWIAAICACLVATVAELFSKRFGLDDNFTIPLCYGAVMQAILSL